MTERRKPSIEQLQDNAWLKRHIYRACLFQTILTLLALKHGGWI
jgi:hypothetical protein